MDGGASDGDEGQRETRFRAVWGRSCKRELWKGGIFVNAVGAYNEIFWNAL